MSLALRYAARSDRGLIREANEDSVYAGPRLLAVADGMGGMAAGEVASNIVIGALAPLDEDATSTDAVEALQAHIEQANLQLRQAVDENPALEGMGTTLTALLFTGNRLALVHVGDSRAYVMHDGELAQITRDDTYVQMLVDEGRITAEEATTHPQRSLLTRALDGRDVDPDASVREARVGDRYLLCSDGLSGVVSAETMAEALRIADPGEAADRLIQLALRGGGPDNITVVVADVVEFDAEDHAPVVAGAAAYDRGRISAAGANSAAERAALAGASSINPDPEPEDDPPTEVTAQERKKPRRWRGLVIGLTALAILAGASYFGWRYTQEQYYVGTTEDGTVAIYRGVHGSIAGIKFSRVVEETDLHVDELDQIAKGDVSDTIWARDRSDAEDKVAQLRRRRLPSCEELAATQQPSPSMTAEANTTQDTISNPQPRPGVNCRQPDDTQASEAQ